MHTSPSDEQRAAYRCVVCSFLKYIVPPTQAQPLLCKGAAEMTVYLSQSFTKLCKASTFEAILTNSESSSLITNDQQYISSEGQSPDMGAGPSLVLLLRSPNRFFMPLPPRQIQDRSCRKLVGPACPGPSFLLPPCVQKHPRCKHPTVTDPPDQRAEFASCLGRRPDYTYTTSRISIKAVGLLCGPMRIRNQHAM